MPSTEQAVNAIEEAGKQLRKQRGAEE